MLASRARFSTGGEHMLITAKTIMLSSQVSIPLPSLLQESFHMLSQDLGGLHGF
jgi:hypothetical protein